MPSSPPLPDHVLFADKDYELFVFTFPDLNISSGTVGHSVVSQMNHRRCMVVEMCLAFSSYVLALNRSPWGQFCWNVRDKSKRKGSHWLTSSGLHGWVTGETVIPERKKWLKEREENLGLVMKMAYSTIFFLIFLIFLFTSWCGFCLLCFPCVLWARMLPCMLPPFSPLQKSSSVTDMKSGACQLCHIPSSGQTTCLKLATSYWRKWNNYIKI